MYIFAIILGVPLLRQSAGVTDVDQVGWWPGAVWGARLVKSVLSKFPLVCIPLLTAGHLAPAGRLAPL